MELLTKTLDMEEEIEEIDDRLETLEDEEKRLVDRAIEIEDALENGDDDDVSQRDFEAIEEQMSALEALKLGVEGYREAVERATEEWDGTEIVLRELSGAETRAIGAKAQRRATKQGLEDYSDSFHETLLLEASVESTPPGCPDADSIGDLPDRLFDWIHERANRLNSTGEFDLGNSSLREKMAERRPRS